MRFSTRMRWATRAASPLRSATEPARLAIWRPSMATGITMAMNSNAASTSASVKAARRLAACAGQLLFVRVANFIGQVVGRLGQPERSPVAADEAQLLGTGFADGPIRQKAN